MSNFWRDGLDSGYYDKILVRGLSTNRGIQANWHNLTFSRVEEYLSKNNQNLEDTKKSINQDTITKLNRTFLLLEICKNNDIQPTEKEINETKQLLVNQKMTNSSGRNLSEEELIAESEYRLKLEKASKYLYEQTSKNIA